jgi:hypothetical protein
MNKEEKDSLIKIIKSEIENIEYISCDFTILHKRLAYNALLNLLIKYDHKFYDYLVNGSRSGGFQSKAFHEYIKLLEESIPFSYRKGNNNCIVDSLLNDNLNIFDGISSFEEIVTDKLVVKNSTKEFYIGGRKGSIAEPFYIGKLLEIIDKNSNKSIIDNVIDYSFSKIKLVNVKPGTEVIVSHLRIPPHYQIGGMVYLNRARKQISDKVFYEKR